MCCCHNNRYRRESSLGLSDRYTAPHTVHSNSTQGCRNGCGFQLFLKKSRKKIQIVDSHSQQQIVAFQSNKLCHSLHALGYK